MTRPIDTGSQPAGSRGLADAVKPRLRAPALDLPAIWRKIFGAAGVPSVQRCAESPADAAGRSPPAVSTAPGRARGGAEAGGEADPANHGPRDRRPAPTEAPPRVRPQPGAFAAIAPASASAPRSATADAPTARRESPDRAAEGPTAHRPLPLAPPPPSSPVEAGTAKAALDAAASDGGDRAGRAARGVDAHDTPRVEWPRESVQVRCRDGSVAVVVRDASITPDAAIRASLQTAFLLGGTRHALERVVLNGRTLYERADALRPGLGASPGGRLCFAC